MIRVLRFPEPSAAVEAEGLAGRLSVLGIDLGGLRVGLPRRARSLWRSYLLGRQIAGRKGQAPPDLIHATGLDAADLAIELAERWRCPYVLTADRFLPPKGRLRISRKWFRGLIVPVEDLRDDLARDLGVPPRWIAVVPPGLAPRPIADRDGPRRVPVVGTAVEAGFGSGLATFLQAAATMKAEGLDAEFVVAQAGDPGFTRGLAEGLGVAGRLTVAEDADLDRSFWPVLDVYCQPARWPSPGLLLASAMARGLPSIASSLPGLRAVAEGGRAARLVPPGDSRALAASIRDLLGDPEAARRLGDAGRDRVSRAFDPDCHAEALARFYEAAAAAPGRPSGRVRADRPASASANFRS